MFTSLTQFLINSKAQNQVIKEYEGIIIYYETDSIPQDIFFIPCKVQYTGSFENFAHEKVKNYQGEITEIFFQGIRWGMPNLQNTFDSMAYLSCKRITGNSGFFKMRMSAGKIFIKIRPNFNKIKSNKKREQFLLELGENEFRFTSGDFDFDTEGLPVFFEPLFLK
jgi:hypothetical protein